MKLSYCWLSDWINPPAMNAEFLERLSMGGLEVESTRAAVESRDNQLCGVSTAKVLEVLPHPNADRLKLCILDAGSHQVQVVCGAPDVSAGKIYAYAPPKAVLPNGVIEERKVRGELSVGMLCSSAELGLGDYYGNQLLSLPDQTPLGEDLYQWLKLDDTIIEFDLTPNRGDCLSVFGLACEVASLYGIRQPKLSPSPVKVSSDSHVNIEIANLDDCPCYTARVIEGINVGAMTPMYIADRLRRFGMRPVNVVADICNYIMLDIGQPMHAFDFDCIDGDICVRRARAGESLELLDNSTLKFSNDDLLITDAKKPIAVAGLMGGSKSGVYQGTQNILLESAWFNPRTLASRARIHGVHSDAAYRYERGVDPELAEYALQRCSALLIDVVGGKAGPVCRQISQKHMPKPPTITVRHARIGHLLGIQLSRYEVKSLFKRLGAQVKTRMSSWKLIPPSRRRDLSTEIDLIEEIARLYGYDRLPTRLPKTQLNFTKVARQTLNKDVVADRLIALGYQEMINYSLVPPKSKLPIGKLVDLSHSVSEDMSALRMSLLPGLLENTLYYQRRHEHNLRLFEIGTCFEMVASKGEDQNRPKERQSLAMLMCGRRNPESWSSHEAQVDFYDLKADLSALLSLSGKTWDLSQSASNSASLLMDAGCCAVIPELNGTMGRLDARWARCLGLRSRPMLVELNLKSLQGDAFDYKPLMAEQPALNRDLAIVVAESTTQKEISECIWQTAQDVFQADSHDSTGTLETLLLFDVYRGSKILAKHKSMAYHLQFRHLLRALNDAEVDKVCAQIVKALNQQFAATLRDS